MVTFSPVRPSGRSGIPPAFFSAARAELIERGRRDGRGTCLDELAAAGFLGMVGHRDRAPLQGEYHRDTGSTGWYSQANAIPSARARGDWRSPILERRPMKTHSRPVPAHRPPRHAVPARVPARRPGGPSRAPRKIASRAARAGSRCSTARTSPAGSSAIPRPRRSGSSATTSGSIRRTPPGCSPSARAARDPRPCSAATTAAARTS